MFSSHNPRYAHSHGLDRTMALIEMAGGVILAPAAVLGLLFVLAKKFAGI